MSKMLKINDCGECPKTCCKYDKQHKLVLYCSELNGTTSKIIDKFKILPNCPLEDYLEPSETRPKHVKLEFYQCEKCECIYQFYNDSQHPKSCPNCLTGDHIIKFNPELLTSDKK